MNKTEGVNCDYLQALATKIENLSTKLDQNVYQGEDKFVHSQNLEKLKPEFLQKYSNLLIALSFCGLKLSDKNK